jgi:hypothetical protein
MSGTPKIIYTCIFGRFSASDTFDDFIKAKNLLGYTLKNPSKVSTKVIFYIGEISIFRFSEISISMSKSEFRFRFLFLFHTFDDEIEIPTQLHSTVISTKFRCRNQNFDFGFDVEIGIPVSI